MSCQSGECARLVLASSSPRRRRLLSERRLRHEVIDPGVDDGQLAPGRVSPRDWAAALAHLKARAGMAAARACGLTGPAMLLLSADTLIEKDGAVIGQARNVAEARTILRLLRGGRHRVITAAVLIHAFGEDWVVDEAEVEFGWVDDVEIELYVASGSWAGKAGAYNLIERIQAGWPIRHAGDPTTVMGLPMLRLEPLILRRLARAPWSAGPW
jgi:septum formation protein